VPLPDIKGRAEIFDLYLEKIKFKGVTAADLAKRTYGFSGADIQNMVNQAVLNCVKNQRLITEDQDFEFAHDRIVMGVGRKNMFVTDKDKMITAYH
jgi:ATP-dependent metalloprotease